MSDNLFLFQFENCTLPKEKFKHRDHLRLAWLYLASYPFEEALSHLKRNLLRFATHLGAQAIYHETLTRVWLCLVQQARQQTPDNFEDFISQHPHLLDKNLPLQYYTQDRLYSDLARQQWVTPDLKTLDS